MCERLIDESITHHQSLCKLLAEENERYTIVFEQNIEKSLSEMKTYLLKLRNLEKEITNLTNQSKNLRKRAECLQLSKQKKDENFAFEMERIKQIEQSLKPVKPNSKC